MAKGPPNRSQGPRGPPILLVYLYYTTVKSSNYSHCKDSFLFRTALYFAILEISFCESEGKTLETFNAKKTASQMGGAPHVRGNILRAPKMVFVDNLCFRTPLSPVQQFQRGVKVRSPNTNSTLPKDFYFFSTL